MHRDNEIVRERQRTIRRQIDQRKISLKALAMDSGIDYSTLLTYFPNPEGKVEPATIGGAAIFALCGHLPADLLSLLLPDGFLVIRAPEGIDHRAVGKWASEYLAAKNAAHDPESECQEAIGPGECNVLDGKVAQFPVAA